MALAHDLGLLTLRERTQVDLVLDQLRGIDTWVRSHRERPVELDRAASRESRLDLARRRDVVARQRGALVDWTTRQLQDSDHLLRTPLATRAVLAHRQPWFTGRLGAGLASGGVAVVAELDNGADALGVVVAEQPDLLVVEDKLPMVSGLDLTRAAAEYAPATAVVAQVAEDWQVGPFLDAGAIVAYTRRTPPADIAAALVAVVR